MKNIILFKNFFLSLVIILFLLLIVLFLGSLFYRYFILPKFCKKICIQMISKVCFLNTPVCFKFPSACCLPPLWFSK